MKIQPTLFGLLFAAALFSCTKETPTPTPDPVVPETSTVQLKFDHVWGPALAPFTMDQALKHPNTGDSMTITLLQYYVTNVKFQLADGSTFSQPHSYHLVRLVSGGLAELTLDNIPLGDYTGFTFTIGVDSVRSTNGPEIGVLSPDNGMYWDTSNGYIFIKVEGRSPQAPDGTFAYHLGGYQTPFNALNTKNFAFNTALSVRQQATPSIRIYVNAARFWHGGLLLANKPSILQPSSDAVSVAANFTAGYVLDNIQN